MTGANAHALAPVITCFEKLRFYVSAKGAVSWMVNELGPDGKPYNADAKNYFIKDGYVIEVEFNGNGVKSAKATTWPSSTGSNQASVVYMFVHFDGIKRFTTGEYEFVNWKDDGKPDIGIDELVNNTLPDVLKDKILPALKRCDECNEIDPYHTHAIRTN